jgi:hypothetical protein
MSLVAWLGVTLFLVLLFILPSPWKHLMWIPYGVLLPIGIVRCNRRQAAIRAEESAGTRPAGEGNLMPS